MTRLHARVFGPGRFARSAYRVREGKGHLSRYCLVAHRGNELIASLRMTEITIGGRTGAALLGPVAVASENRNIGIGKRLMHEALEAAERGGTDLVVLVGDLPYYGRFGFKPVPLGQILFPGPVNPGRILAREIREGALQDFRGLIVAQPSQSIGS